MVHGSCQQIDILACGVAAKTLEGESETGDVHFVQATRDGALVAVVDGLGHGQHAAAASQRAIATLAANADKSVIALVNECHAALRGTRGVVMSLASFNANENTMTWIGVGNIEGRLLRADVDGTSTHETLIQRGGVVGYQLPSLRAMVVSVAVGDTLLLFTDGIQSGFTIILPVHDQPQKVAEHILMQHGRGTDDALVFVARYLGKAK